VVKFRASVPLSLESMQCVELFKCQPNCSGHDSLGLYFNRALK